MIYTRAYGYYVWETKSGWVVTALHPSEISEEARRGLIRYPSLAVATAEAERIKKESGV